MITYKEGDIFTSTMPAIGHGVNCLGVMGSGIAVAFARKIPGLEKQYIKECEAGRILPGYLFPFQAEPAEDGTIYPLVLNIASQNLPGPNASYEFLRVGVWHAFMYCAYKGIKGFALPLIGCGIGGLEWESENESEDVKSILLDVAEDFPEIELEVWFF